MSFQEEIANALERVLAEAKKGEGNIVHTEEILRKDRELLLKTHWLQPIVKGWYMISRPDVQQGESSIWYANYWKFISKYLKYHFGDNYCLSAESSIDLHTDISSIPSQIIVIVATSGGSVVKLPLQTSILSYKDPKNIPQEKTEVKGIQTMELGYALCKITPISFEKDPGKLEIALRLIRSPDELLSPILKYSLLSSANRLIGAYRFLGDNDMADHLEGGLEPFGVRLKPENPFHHMKPLTDSRAKSPYTARILSMWKSYRDIVLAEVPSLALVSGKDQYFVQMDEIYKDDAYNSLSIEGYEVDQQLIEKVRGNLWNPDGSFEDKESRNALAARGYYEAFQEVKKSILKIFDQANPGKVLEKDLSKWYSSLFAPSVRVGILKPTDILGYRKFPVYIRGSRHIPLPKEALLDAMETLFLCLQEELHPFVRAVLGHFIFVYIHPYMDGNGRISRFLMNAMFASGGYPWTIVHLKNRQEYLSSLEEASTNNNIQPFARFIAKELSASGKNKQRI